MNSIKKSDPLKGVGSEYRSRRLRAETNVELSPIRARRRRQSFASIHKRVGGI